MEELAKKIYELRECANIIITLPIKKIDGIPVCVYIACKRFETCIEYIIEYVVDISVVYCENDTNSRRCTIRDSPDKEETIDKIMEGIDILTRLKFDKFDSMFYDSERESEIHRKGVVDACMKTFDECINIEMHEKCCVCMEVTEQKTCIMLRCFIQLRDKTCPLCRCEDLSLQCKCFECRTRVQN